MRRLLLSLGLLLVVAPVYAATRVTVAQLRQFFEEPKTRKLSDARIAERLSAAELSVQVTEPELARMLAGVRMGPETAEQVRLLAAASVFADPPPSESLNRPAPDPAAQQQMIRSARQYVRTTLHHLPDFLATRATTCYDSQPFTGDRDNEKPVLRLHWERRYLRDISYRDGSEQAALTTNAPGSSQARYPTGFSTWGEFGPILDIVLGDSFQGDMVWKRWQRSETGALIAVFHYTVTQPASHYLVDFCCYKPSDEAGWINFREKPAYHGDLYIDSQTGAIERIKLQADLREGDPVSENGFVVQYGRVEIAGKEYICPLRSVAIAAIDPMPMRSAEREPLVRYLNEVSFSNYHKFGSTAQIVTVPQATKQGTGTN